MNRGLHDAVKSAASSAVDHTARIGGRYVRCTFVNDAGERCFAGQGHTVDHHFQSDHDAMRAGERKATA